MSSRLMTIVSVLLFFVVMPLSADVLDQGFTPSPVTLTSGVGGGVDKAQTFTAGMDGLLTQVDIYFSSANSSANLLFDIRETTGGVPNESDTSTLASLVVPGSIITTNGFFSFDVSQFNINIQTGDVLAFALRSSNANNVASIGGQSSNPYSGGTTYFRNPSYGYPTWTVGSSDSDFGFQTWVSTDIYWAAASGGWWDTGANWDCTGGPQSYSNVYITPANGLNVVGPAATETLDSLNVGATSGGVASLLLQDTGTLNVTDTTTIGDLGRIAGNGTYNAAGGIDNAGEIDLGYNSLQLVGGTLSNTGTILGSGRIDNNLTNNAAGQINSTSGQRLVFAGSTNTNSGDMILQNGEVAFSQGLTNASAGNILGRGTLRTADGLTNQGDIAFSAGVTDVFGDVQNNSGGNIIVSGQANVSFWDDVIHNGSQFKVAADSVATFFGSYGGSGISGSGDVYFESDVTPGSSPGIADFGGNVHLQALAKLVIEFAGTDNTNPMSPEFDQLNIDQLLDIDGHLSLELIENFIMQLGDECDILTYLTRSGYFQTISGIKTDSGVYLAVTYDDTAGAITVTGALGGDTNLDGQVGLLDLDALGHHWASQDGAIWANGDFNGDGVIGLLDLDTLGQHWGETTTVPEPAGLMLVLLAACSVMARRD